MLVLAAGYAEPSLHLRRCLWKRQIKNEEETKLPEQIITLKRRYNMKIEEKREDGELPDVVPSPLPRRE